MDTRGQGSTWSPGDDAGHRERARRGRAGWRPPPGLRDPRGRATRRPGTTAASSRTRSSRSTRSLRHPLVDAVRIAVTGKSQGGGLALAAAGLSGVVRAAAIDVPFMCRWRRAVEITDDDPYGELTRYLLDPPRAEDGVFRTLSYVDGLNFAARATAPALFSVGLDGRHLPALDGLRRVQPLRRPARTSASGRSTATRRAS